MPEDKIERFIRLLTANQEQIYRYAFALLVNEHDAKDVVQETCIALYRKIDEYDPQQPFLPWAFRFAYLEVLKHRERKRKWPEWLPSDLVETLAEDRSRHRALLDAQLAALERCLQELPPADTELVQARFRTAGPVDEVVAQFDMSRRTFYRNLERIRRLLLDCIQRQMGVEGLS